LAHTTSGDAATSDKPSGGKIIESGKYVPREWVEVEKCLGDAVDGYRTESSLQFDGGWIEVRQYQVLGPAECVWTTSGWSYFIDISLTPRLCSTGMLFGVGHGTAPEALSRIMVVPPGQKVRSGSTGGRYRTMRCVLDASLIDSILQRKAVWSAKSLRQAFRFQGGQIEWLLLKIYQEVSNREFASSVVVEALIKALAVELIRRFQLDREDTSRRVGGLAPWRMGLLRERIHADGPAPDLAELAELCGMTVRHLTRAFHVETGQTLGAFVRASLIERARTLLGETDVPIGEIARSFGFASSGSFGQAFYRATGMLPSKVERLGGDRAHRKPGETDAVV
jgi:AraC-like DNA-binding protein